MRSNPTQEREIAALRSKLADLQNVVDNFGKFWHRAVPSIKALLGDDVRKVGPTEDQQGMIYATKDGLIKATALPATRTFLIQGFDDDAGIVPLEVTVSKKGQLAELDTLKILATCAAIRMVAAGKPNPLLVTDLTVAGIVSPAPVAVPQFP